MGTLYAGVWRQGSDPYYLWGGVDWNSFNSKWQELSGKGLRLIDLKVYTGNGATKFSGVWRGGNDAHYLWVGVDWNNFNAKWQELSAKNLRLVDLEIYQEGGKTKYAGVWRAGSDAHYLWAGVDWNNFNAKWQELAGQGLRLTNIQVYKEGNAWKYAGVWRAGTDAHYLWVGVDWNSFNAKWQELSAKNLRLVDIDIYQDGGETKFAGVWRAGSDAHYLWVGVDWENFTGKWYELGQKNLRLTNMEIYPGGCSDSYMNQVVMPDDPSTPYADTYNYGINASATHCKGPGTCPAPHPGDQVVYHWPCATFDGSARYARLSAVMFDDAPLFKLPFKDTKVKQRGPWLYKPGSWHHAIDFSRDDAESFPVCAAAAGKVVHIGWDWWSGNTIVISHDSGNVKDAFRTIYMHLRNGPTNDADNSWNVTLGNLGEPQHTQYMNYLKNTGCPQGGPYHANATYWGTDADKINMGLLGQHVNQGDVIAHSGCTGPGGCGCVDPDSNWTWGGGVNTHLHIFFARRDPTDGEWYFIDPYGIYSSGTPYPGFNQAITTPCARYPVMWVGKKAQYP